MEILMDVLKKKQKNSVLSKEYAIIAGVLILLQSEKFKREMLNGCLIIKDGKKAYKIIKKEVKDAKMFAFFKNSKYLNEKVNGRTRIANLVDFFGRRFNLPSEEKELENFYKDFLDFANLLKK